jgi:hypothetical protein
MPADAQEFQDDVRVLHVGDRLPRRPSRTHRRAAL